MQQSGATNLPPRATDIVGLAAISTDERKTILKDSSRNAILKLPKKRDLLVSLYDVKASIFERALSFDAFKGTTNFGPLFQRLFPRNKKSITDGNNDYCTTTILSLIDPLFILHAHIKEQHDDHETIRRERGLRSTSSTNDAASDPIFATNYFDR